MAFARESVLMTPERSTIGPASQRDDQGSWGVDATATARRRALGVAPREANLTTAGRRLPARTILNDSILTQVCALIRTALGGPSALAHTIAARVAYPHDHNGTRCPESGEGGH